MLGGSFSDLRLSCDARLDSLITMSVAALLLKRLLRHGLDPREVHREAAPRLGGEEGQEPTSRELLAEHDRARCTGSVHLEDKPGRAQDDGANTSHGRLLR